MFLPSLSLLIGLSFAVLVNHLRGNGTVAEPAITLAFQPTQSMRTSQFSGRAGFWGSMQSGKPRQMAIGATETAGVADKVNSLLKESFPDAKDLSVKSFGSTGDSAHLSVDVQFQSEAKPLEPALAASLAKAADESRGLAMD